MKTLLTVFTTALACILLTGFALSHFRRNIVPKQTDVTVGPGRQNITLGPSTKHVDVISKRGKKLFSLNITEPSKEIRIQREGDTNISVKPQP